ncbi:hypothetical protein Q0A17_05395 [Citrobacter sp. S2-9]|uniref:Zinc ribbon domain-containing protein n=1 Tax=Citrobacter enshiensis TaxID=2971264 RepID=A0ABT8PRN0_9ENTR|nr:hypothetical protein [Citrobacter enshiensis]MDN8598850.1 hypothetical protein [Citrobacter enshiensis]
MDRTTTICPFCHSVLFIGTKRCICCNATIEYGRIPPRCLLLLVGITSAIFVGVHLLCEYAALNGFLLETGIVTVLCLIVWLKAIRILNKRYKGRIRYTR